MKNVTDAGIGSGIPLNGVAVWLVLVKNSGREGGESPGDLKFPFFHYGDRRGRPP